MYRSWVLWGVGLALVGSACSGDSAFESLGGTPEAVSYLEVVAEIEREYALGFQQVVQAITQSYATRGLLFETVGKVDFAGAAATALDDAQSATPPPDFAQEHDEWVQFRTVLVGVVEELESALARENMQELLAVNTSADQAHGSFLKGLTRTFCLAAAPDDSFCPAGADLPGGEYGQQVYEILRSHRLDVRGLFFFVEDMSPEERAVRLDEVQPEIESHLRSAGDAMARIEPPAEFAIEHDAFVRFFNESSVTAAAITEANSARDTERVLELFDEAARNGDRLESSLTPAYGPIAVAFLGA
ncbi:MAG: hypothetical protein QGM46_06760 [Actinomycetota bacterium]|nr:hypothetical protein [Actinomycetota bacterium]MDK1017355.1 hypothetical protein [Actinomycetota bacterium]MDK1019977.1 hypothetical protein [Actinomycetota bacterium]MDK1027666.1 hypothetical protein [Actinomycetota bacterium]MDK1037512.1 hypothetical protein [Actinomycetota bacterium]